MFTQLFPILTTPDLDRALRFYRDLLGAAVTYSFPGPDGAPAYVGLELGASHFGVGHDPEGAAGERRAISLWVYTADCDAAVDRLRAAGVVVLDRAGRPAVGGAGGPRPRSGRQHRDRRRARRLTADPASPGGTRPTPEADAPGGAPRAQRRQPRPDGGGLQVALRVAVLQEAPPSAVGLRVVLPDDPPEQQGHQEDPQPLEQGQREPHRQQQEPQQQDHAGSLPHAAPGHQKRPVTGSARARPEATGTTGTTRRRERGGSAPAPCRRRTRRAPPAGCAPPAPPWRRPAAPPPARRAAPTRSPAAGTCRR